MKDIIDILPLVSQHAPGCPVPTALYGLRQAAIDFCRRTHLWRYEEEFDITENEVVALTPPTGAVLYDIETALFEGQKLEPKTVAWLDENMLGWRAGTLLGQSCYITQTDYNTVRLVPAQDGHVNVYGWLQPAQDATQLPDFMVDQYREVLAHGALARILAIPGQPFSNPQAALTWGALFNGELDGLSTKGSRGQQRARTRTKASFM